MDDIMSIFFHVVFHMSHDLTDDNLWTEILLSFMTRQLHKISIYSQFSHTLLTNQENNGDNKYQTLEMFYKYPALTDSSCLLMNSTPIYHTLRAVRWT